jgi:HEAT repeat protein
MMRAVDPFEFPKYDLVRDRGYFEDLASHPDVDVRNMFLKHLDTGRTYGPDVRDWVRRLASDADYSVKIGVMDMLRRKDRKLLMDLMGGLIDDPSPFVRRHVVRILAGMDSERVGDRLVQMASDDHPTVRELVAEMLPKSRVEGIAGAIALLCRDEDSRVMIAAARSAMELPSMESDPIIDGMEHGGTVSRRCLAEAFAEAKCVRMSTVLTLAADESQDVRLAIAKSVLARRDLSMFEVMEGLVGDASPKVRATVASYMGICGTPRSESLLSELIRDSDDKVKEAAADAMVASGAIW